MKKTFLTLFLILMFTVTAAVCVSAENNIEIGDNSIKITGDADVLYSVYVYQPYTKASADLVKSFAGARDSSDMPSMSANADLSEILADAAVVMSDENGVATYDAASLMTGIYNVEIIGEGSSEPYTFYFPKNKEKLFEENAEEHLSDADIKPALSLLTDKSLTDITKAYNTFVGLTDKTSAIKLMNKKPEYYFVASFMQKALEESSKNQTLLKNIENEMKLLSIDSEAITLLGKNVNYQAVTADIKNSTYTNMETFLSNVKTASVLRGIQNVVNDKDAKVFLAAIGNEKYDTASETNKNFIANKLYGNYYGSIDTLNLKINELELPSGGGDGGDGGGGASSKPSSSMSVTTAEQTKTVFNDVSKNHWCYSYINKMVDMGIVNGYGNEFLPEKQITRAEFIKILCMSFGTETGGSTAFKDVNENDWYAPYINAAYNMDIAQGSDGFFYPDREITRQDAATLAVRFAEANGMKFEKSVSSFEDAASIDAYALDAVNKLVNSKIINGYTDNTFKPKNSATRAEATKIIYQLLVKGGKIK